MKNAATIAVVLTILLIAAPLLKREDVVGKSIRLTHGLLDRLGMPTASKEIPEKVPSTSSSVDEAARREQALERERALKRERALQKEEYSELCRKADARCREAVLSWHAKQGSGPPDNSRGKIWDGHFKPAGDIWALPVAAAIGLGNSLPSDISKIDNVVYAVLGEDPVGSLQSSAFSMEWPKIPNSIDRCHLYLIDMRTPAVMAYTYYETYKVKHVGTGFGHGWGKSKVEAQMMADRQAYGYAEKVRLTPERLKSDYFSWLGRLPYPKSMWRNVRLGKGTLVTRSCAQWSNMSHYSNLEDFTREVERLKRNKSLIQLPVDTKAALTGAKSGSYRQIRILHGNYALLTGWVRSDFSQWLNELKEGSVVARKKQQEDARKRKEEEAKAKAQYVGRLVKVTCDIAWIKWNDRTLGTAQEGKYFKVHDAKADDFGRLMLRVGLSPKERKGCDFGFVMPGRSIPPFGWIEADDVEVVRQ